MKPPALLQRYRDPIEAGLVKALQGESLLYRVLRYHVGLEDEQGRAVRRAGKLLRPSLVLFTAEELGGKVAEGLPAALALEMIHNFSLIHDDIQDRDRTRRGRPTVWSQHGIAQAINAGDLMLARAFSVAQDATSKREITTLLVEAATEMIEGQAFDLAFEGEIVGIEPYLEMVDKKTGALMRCAFHLGALIAQAAAGVIEQLVALGRELGRAFQIRDDLLGIWGDGEITGKPQGSDIRRKKASLPMAILFERASDDQRSVLRGVYDREEIASHDVASVMRLMEELDVRRIGEGMMLKHLDWARTHLMALPFSDQGKKEMDAFLDYLARRKR
jgi:geranylgeranyl diphosphate synthase type I